MEKQYSILPVLFIALMPMVFLTGCGSSTSFSSPPATWLGIKQMGVPGADTKGFSTSTDISGNVYVAGYTRGGLDGNTRTGLYDFFLTKYNSSGTKLYTKQMGGAGLTYGNSTATDISGNVYVAGYTNISFDGNTSTDIYDFFLTKYDSSGTNLYTKQMGVAGEYTFGYSTATDASGNVYVAGYTSGGLDGNTLMGVITDFFLTKYNSSGTKLYTKQMGAGTVTYATSTATDGSGNVYVAGETTGGLDGNTLTGGSDFFLTKYDSTGTKLYTKQMGVSGAYTYATSTATDGSGNVYVAGETSGGLDGNTLTGGHDFFLTKYDSSGTKLYTKQMGVPGADTVGLSTATDGSGNVYVAGYTTGGLDGNSRKGNYDFFLTKYDSTGTKLYTKQMGVAGADTEGFSTATDGSGNVYVAGYTSGGLDGNTQTGNYDFFLSRYNSAGTLQ